MWSENSAIFTAMTCCVCKIKFDLRFFYSLVSGSKLKLFHKCCMLMKEKERERNKEKIRWKDIGRYLVTKYNIIYYVQTIVVGTYLSNKQVI